MRNIVLDNTVPQLFGHHGWLDNWITITEQNVDIQLIIFSFDTIPDLLDGNEHIKWTQLKPPAFSFLNPAAAKKRVIKKALQLLPNYTWVTANMLSIITGLPHQCLYVDDIGFLMKQPFYPPKFTHKIFTRAITNATTIVTPYSYYYFFLKKQYAATANKLHVSSPFISSFATTLSWAQREAVKVKFAAGKDFFYYTSSAPFAEDLINVLKAFSVFKKWQQSGMQLVIGLEAATDIDIKEKLETYKYKDDVHITALATEAEEMEILGAAYAAIIADGKDSTAPIIIHAMQMEVPVITNEIALLKEITGNNVLYGWLDNYEIIGRHLINFYKDEGMKNSLQAAAKQQISNLLQQPASFSWRSILH
jgi:hypothetical protein